MAKVTFLGKEIDIEGADENYLKKLAEYVESVYYEVEKKNDGEIYDSLLLVEITALSMANDYFKLLEKYKNLEKKLNEKYQEIETILKRIG